MKTFTRATICVLAALAAFTRLADAAEMVGSASHGALGVRLSNPPAAAAAVTALIWNNPAGVAGSQPGDRIFSINGQVMTDPQKVIAALMKTAPGAKIELGEMRLGKLSVTLADSRKVFQTRPVEPTRAADGRSLQRRHQDQRARGPSRLPTSTTGTVTAISPATADSRLGIAGTIGQFCICSLIQTY